jgi:serine/threonine protein kinase
MKVLLVNTEFNFSHFTEQRRAIHKNIDIITDDVGREWIWKKYDDIKFAEKEAVQLRLLNHVKNIPKLLMNEKNDDKFINVIEKMPGVDLFDYLIINGKLPEKELKAIAKNILLVLKDLYEHNVIHGDIKPENIIYDQKTSAISIVDFEGKYSEDYASPEQLQGETITHKSDIWNIGAVILICFNYCKPFVGISYKRRPHFGNIKNSLMKDFLKNLLKGNKDKRYDVYQALNHEWLNSD